MPPGRADLLFDQVIVVEKPLGRWCDSPPALDPLGDELVRLAQQLFIVRETAKKPIRTASADADLVPSGQRLCISIQLFDAV